MCRYGLLSGKMASTLVNSFYSSMDELNRLNTQFGIYLAEEINFFCKKNKINQL
ncbi:MAG: hypothetical protein U0T81_04685 [Saprospiraceae bacterium]